MTEKDPSLFESSGDKVVKPQKDRKNIGEILVDEEKISKQQLTESLKDQKEKDSSQMLGEILVDKDYVTDTDLSRVLAKQLDLPFYDKLPVNDIDPRLIIDIPVNFCKLHSLLPIAKDEFCCTVATLLIFFRLMIYAFYWGQISIWWWLLMTLF